ncbi:hypothetical protein ACLKA6_005566 [Drosophila palustris]
MRGTSATSIKVLPVPPNWIYATFMCRCKFVELRRSAARAKNQQDNESWQGNNGATGQRAGGNTGSMRRSCGNHKLDAKRANNCKLLPRRTTFEDFK